MKLEEIENKMNDYGDNLFNKSYWNGIYQELLSLKEKSNENELLKIDTLISQVLYILSYFDKDKANKPEQK